MKTHKHYLQILEESFPGIRENILRCEALGFSWEAGKVFIKENKGCISSHVSFFECPVLVEGRWHRAGALHAICTQEAFRGQGFASELIREALEWAKERCEFTILFTEIPLFYEKFSFHSVQECRFRLDCQHPKGLQPLRPIEVSQDHSLFLRCFREREPLSNRLWLKDDGRIAAFNTLFATYPRYWSLYYSPAIDGLISYFLEGTTLHLLDVIARKIPSLELILEHIPDAIDRVYFYFSPDRFAPAAVAEGYLYDKGHLMVHGALPAIKPFMIAPLSRF